MDTTYLEGHTLPLFLGYLVLWLGSPIYKIRHLKKGVEYEPIGTCKAKLPNDSGDAQTGLRVAGPGFKDLRLGSGITVT